MKKIFLNDLDKVRPIWRTLIFILTFFILNIPIQILLQNSLPRGLVRSTIAASTYFGSVLFCIWFQIKFLDKSSFKKFGLKITREWLKEFAYGCLISVVQLSLFFILLYATGNLEIVGSFGVYFENIGFAEGFFHEMYSMLLGASVEEIFFRAFIFYTVYEAMRKIIPGEKKRSYFIVFIIAPLFGLAHIANDHASTLSTVNLALDAIIICLPFILTGRLGMSIGMHFSWNFIQGIIMGFAVSGNTHKVTLLVIETKDNLLTGGAFGIEASILCTLSSFLAYFMILAWKRRVKSQWIHQSIVQTPLKQY